MATHKKTNEVWFGDTFNRDTTLCFATEDGSSYAAAVQAINWEDANNVTITCNDITSDNTMLDGLCIKDDSFAINAISNCTDKIHNLQAQIDDLKKKIESKKENSELRLALKTLHYKREVE